MAAAGPRPLLEDATRRLATAGVPSPRVDAELLLAHALGVPRSRLALSAVPDPAAAAFETALRRRIAREPLQHITGRAPFRYVELAVGSGVFVPRPETELLVDAVLPALRGAPAPVAVDLCAGSGALAVALADEVATARVLAVERPGPSVAWLLRNTRETRVAVLVADIAEAGPLAGLRGGVDAVVCNPPYVPAAAAVTAEVRFDPEAAVFAGADGLALMPAVLARAAELLRPGGVLAVEHDDTHGTAVPRLLRSAGDWTEIADHRDLAGRPRYATALRA